MKVLINNEEVNCKIVENLGYNHTIGKYGKVVLYNNEEIIVVKEGKIWKPTSIIASVSKSGECKGM